MGELGNKHAVYGVWAGSNPGLLALPQVGGGSCCTCRTKLRFQGKKGTQGTREHTMLVLFGPLGFTV